MNNTELLAAITTGAAGPMETLATGMIVVGLGVLGIAISFILAKWAYGKIIGYFKLR